MKKNLKKLSFLTAISLAISSFSFAVSAESVDVNDSVIMMRQEASMEDYEELLNSFVIEKEIDYPDDFGGIYFDNKTGITTLCLTNMNNYKEYKKIFDNTLLKINEVKYSFDELNNTFYLISENLKEINVTSVSISEITNDLEVSVQAEEDKSNLIEFIKSYGYEPSMLRFVENSFPVEYELYEPIDEYVNYNTPTVYEACAGERILGNYSGNIRFIGTIGANAYNPSTNQYGVVTAGHVGGISSVTAFCNSSGITMNHHTGVLSNFSDNCDAAFIPFNSSNSFISSTSIKNDGIVTYIYRKQPIVSPYMVGYQVVKYGGTTNRKTGVITHLSHSVQYTNVELTDMIQYEMEREGGDSGAPVGIEYSNSDGFHLMGIHSGGSGNVCYATKYLNIENELGIIILSTI